jgi:signal peptidase I
MFVMKRVVGIPGDTVAMVQGHFIRNGQAVNEPYAITGELDSEDAMQRAKMRLWQLNFYVGNDTPAYQPDISDWGPLVVAPESYFTLGDNRNFAYDSRYWGFVPAENITGQPRVVYWSYDPESYKPMPGFFAVRWDRIGKDLSR